MFVRVAVSVVGAGPVPAGALVGATEADEAAARSALTPTDTDHRFPSELSFTLKCSHDARRTGVHTYIPIYTTADAIKIFRRLIDKYSIINVY